MTTGHQDVPAERSVSSSVEVAVDPATAFLAFTDELDLWWVRGPINHHAGGRVTAMRCEPGIGGRLLEQHFNVESVASPCGVTHLTFTRP